MLINSMLIDLDPSQLHFIVFTKAITFYAFYGFMILKSNNEHMLYNGENLLIIKYVFVILPFPPFKEPFAYVGLTVTHLSPALQQRPTTALPKFLC